MRMYDIIMKKRSGTALSEAEIAWFVKGYTESDIPDYQASALMMAIWFKGMDSRETAQLTQYMACSGEMVDLSEIPGIKVDKHSTGGVGDKTTLVVAPIVASCGVPVAKMSGRGLGHTGGTIDKLESIPGFQVSLSRERFFQIVRDSGLAIIGQSGNITPADKKIYALRDVTATVDSLPLIASSIMSKKLAAGSDAIVLDVKTGSGAFMKTLDDSIALAQAMVDIGTHNGRRMTALITDMDRPLGFAIGNSLEVAEAVRTLCGNGPEDLTEVSLQLASNMLELAGKGTLNECRKLAESVVENGKAHLKLCDMVKLQGGDVSVIEDPSSFIVAPFMEEVKAPSSGYIVKMQTEDCGIAAMLLGAGRENKDDRIDYGAGVVLTKKSGDAVLAGETIAKLYSSNRTLFEGARERLLNATEIEAKCPPKEKLIYARVTKDEVLRY